MNSEQAKQIRIEDYLSRIGIKPSKERGHNLWYKSPFRNESEPSFKVNRNINQWRDFGSGEKGNIIDLAMKLHQTNSVSDALRAIEQAVPNPQIHQSSFSFRQQEILDEIFDVKIKPLNHPALIEMLKKRKTPMDLARKYCKEAHYTLKGKAYFAVAFPNDKGGFETLNPYFKGCLPPKEMFIFSRDLWTISACSLCKLGKLMFQRLFSTQPPTSKKLSRFSRNTKKSTRFWIMMKQDSRR